MTDYYTIVKKPICLKDIQNKLERNQYATPTEMYLVRLSCVGKVFLFGILSNLPKERWCVLLPLHAIATA